LRSSAGDPAATSSKVAQVAVTKPAGRRAAAEVTFARSAPADDSRKRVQAQASFNTACELD
jgi:hypothetical protein